jgi:uncharacterized protein YqeY
LSVEKRLRADLAAAMRERDRVRVQTIRALVAAIDNAGAVDAEIDTYEVKVGLGHDVARREMSNSDMRRILIEERDDLARAGAEYRGLGEAGRADELEEMARIVGGYID